MQCRLGRRRWVRVRRRDLVAASCNGLSTETPSVTRARTTKLIIARKCHWAERLYLESLFENCSPWSFHVTASRGIGLGREPSPRAFSFAARTSSGITPQAPRNRQNE